MEKEEIACNEQFLLFQQCFLLNQKIVSPFVNILTSYLYLLLNWKSPKLAYEAKGQLPKIFHVLRHRLPPSPIPPSFRKENITCGSSTLHKYIKLDLQYTRRPIFQNLLKKNKIDWLVALGFNPTLTYHILSWRSVTHMCFLVFSHQYLHKFSFHSHRLLFTHASAEVRGENTPKRKFASTGSRTHNHQVMSPTRSPLRKKLVSKITDCEKTCI